MPVGLHSRQFLAPFRTQVPSLDAVRHEVHPQVFNACDYLQLANEAGEVARQVGRPDDKIGVPRAGKNLYREGLRLVAVYEAPVFVLSGEVPAVAEIAADIRGETDLFEKP